MPSFLFLKALIKFIFAVQKIVNAILKFALGGTTWHDQTSRCLYMQWVSTRGRVMSIRHFQIVVAFSLSTVVGITTALAIDPPITRSINRTAYHEVGTATMSRKMLMSIGGVQSQASYLVGRSGSKVPILLKISKAHGDYTGELVVTTPNGAGKYRLGYDDLVPMALFIDGGGTSLYTYWDEKDRVASDFRYRAGFTKHEHEGLVAIEFARTRFAASLFYADFCEICLGRVRPDLVAKMGGRSTSEGRPIIDGHTEDNSYLNTDYQLVFGISNADDRVSIDGNVARIFWTIQQDASHGKPWRVQTFMTSNQLQGQIRSRETAHLVDKGLYRDSTYGHALALHRDVQFLFASLALLRTFKDTAPKADWARFIADVRSLATRHPAPWRSYTTSYCEVYPKDCRS